MNTVLEYGFYQIMFQIYDEIKYHVDSQIYNQLQFSLIEYVNSGVRAGTWIQTHTQVKDQIEAELIRPRGA